MPRGSGAPNVRQADSASHNDVFHTQADMEHNFSRARLSLLPFLPRSPYSVAVPWAPSGESKLGPTHSIIDPLVVTEVEVEMPRWQNKAVSTVCLL